MRICRKCKNTIDESDSVVGGYVCKICKRFTPKLEENFHGLEKPATRQLYFKELVKKINKGLTNIFKGEWIK